MQARAVLHRFAQRHVSWDGDHRNASPRKRRLHRNLQNAWHLFRLRYQFTVMAALREEMFGFGLLKISAANFIAGNLRGDSQYGNATAVTVVQPVDQMQVPGSAASRANRQPPGEMRLRSSSKGRRLFMSHMNPLNLFLRAN